MSQCSDRHAGSIHGVCNRCGMRLPKPNHVPQIPPSKGWTGSKPRDKTMKRKAKKPTWAV